MCDATYRERRASYGLRLQRVGPAHNADTLLRGHSLCSWESIKQASFWMSVVELLRVLLVLLVIVDETWHMRPVLSAAANREGAHARQRNDGGGRVARDAGGSALVIIILHQGRRTARCPRNTGHGRQTEKY